MPNAALMLPQWLTPARSRCCNDECWPARGAGVVICDEQAATRYWRVFVSFNLLAVRPPLYVGGSCPRHTEGGSG